MKVICSDLSQEYEALDAIVAAFDESGWNIMTLFSYGRMVSFQGVASVFPGKGKIVRLH